jgi:hypothetical protein
VIRRCSILFLKLAILMSMIAISARAQTGSPATSSSGYSANPNSTGPSTSAIQSQSPFSGSVPGKLVPGFIQISLQDALDRGLKHNLGLLLSNEDIRSARGERWTQSISPHWESASQDFLLWSVHFRILILART